MPSNQQSACGESSMANGQGQSQTAADIEEWLVSYLSAKLQREPGEIDRRKSLNYYGICSTEALTLAGDLEDYLGRSVSPSLSWNYPTIESMAKYLGSDIPFAESAYEGDVYEQSLERLLAAVEKS